jgi:glycosyl hydrolase family 99
MSEGMHRTALVALGLMAVAAPAAAAQSYWWTPAQARALLAASSPLSLTDRHQVDAPQFALDFDLVSARRLRPSGRSKVIRGHRVWSRFAFRGLARDELTTRVVAVRFVLLARGPRRLALRSFRGPPANRFQPTLPIRAAFYYPWFPEAWHQRGIDPFAHFRPSLGYYDSREPQLVRRHIDALRYGRFDAGIYSWWGVGSRTDSRLASYLGSARQTRLRWAIYYEQEGYSNPPAARIAADLKYIRDSYGHKPAYLRIGGRLVVFVYHDAGETCETAERWRQANSKIHAFVVLAVFHGYRSCPAQPDGWHQYGVNFATGEDSQRGYSFSIMPGFWFAADSSPRFPRDLDRWRRNVQDMVASRAPFQLVISFNEWGEGTAVEGAGDWMSSSGYGAYLDVLHRFGAG